MGCVGSKLEESDAVALCRERSGFLAEAMRHRYALADAHAAYADSLRSVGAAIHDILSSGHGPHLQGSPILPLPAHRKGNPLPPLSPPTAAAEEADAFPLPLSHTYSRSQSGSHIHFHSSDDSDSDDDSALHSDDDGQVHLHSSHLETSGPTYFNLHYARNNPPPPSVSVEQRVASPEQVHYASASSDPYGHQYSGQNSTSSPYSFPYAYQPYGYSGMDGFFVTSSPLPSLPRHPQTGPESNFKASISQAAPLPPSPRTSTWDFLNPFETFQSYYPPYTPSRSSKELREDEGIPDLEEDKMEVIKQSYGDQKFVASTSVPISAPEYSSESASVAKKDVGGSSADGSHFHPSPNKEDEEVVEKNIVVGEMQKSLEARRKAVPSRRYHDVSEFASEIRIQFERAAESTKELASILEVGKQPYNRKSSVYEVSSRIMCGNPFSMRKGEVLSYEEDKVMRTGNLSSTLQKLYIWERKLYDEVRVEEKMRFLLDRSTKRLQHLDKRGAEAHKIEVTQTLNRKLSTKIRIEIQVVNTISTKISMLRDEELWPQIVELIHGLDKMWRAMLECHQIQSQAMSGSNHLSFIESGGNLSHEHINSLKQLQLELQRWMSNFCSLITSQKNLVKSLNSWLLLCLHHEPEVATDKRAAPHPIFDIFTNWCQTIDRVSMKEVLEAMHSSFASLIRIQQGNGAELHQNAVAFKEVERLNKQLDLHAEPVRFQSALKQVFQAMESFAGSKMTFYGDLRGLAMEEVTALEGDK